VVRRFLRETSSGGNLDRIDELVAPNYVNRGMGNVDLAGFKAMLSGMPAASDVEIEDLVAEGDAVVLRATMNISLASGRRANRSRAPRPLAFAASAGINPRQGPAYCADG